MRYLFGFICVLALGIMGCSETSGTGGSGGSAGDGGAGGGMPECRSPGDCDDDNECTDDTCLAGVCEFMPVPDPTGPEKPGDPPGDGTTCGYYAGTCEAGSCVGTFACTEAGIREAIAAGAGPHGFDCAGPTTVVTTDTILIDNDVILDGEGNLTVDGKDDHRVFLVQDEDITDTGQVDPPIAELRGFTVTGGTASGVGADALGGGIWAGGSTTLTNTLVNDGCRGGLVSGGYNIESPGDTCGFDQTGDQVSVTAEQLNLGSLADNGGPTMTHALEAGSVAIDVIPEDDCVDAEGELLAADQRGEPRFVGLPFGPFEPVGDGCDVGAFEVQP
jgi:hypothetical protein